MALKFAACQRAIDLSMSKILMISHDAYMYGAQRSLLDIAVGLSNIGHKVDVCMPAEGELADKLRDSNVCVRILRFGRWIPGSYANRAGLWMKVFTDVFLGTVRAYRLLRSNRYEVIYTNTVTVLDFAIAAKLNRIPHIWHLREAPEGNPQLLSLLPNRMVASIVRKLSNRVIYNSHYLLSRYGRRTAKDVVIHNGIQLPPHRPTKIAEPERKITAVTIGFMEHRKGLDILLDAMLLLPEALRHKMILRVAGDIDKDYLSREIAPRLDQLGESVELLGWVDDIDEVFADADLLVSSARDEPFGRTLVEAMMSSVAVLATRSGGPEEIVLDGTTGVLVPSNSPQQLCNSLVRLLEDPAQLTAFGRAGRKRALRLFALDTCVHKVEECLAQAITRNN
jgi:glycosyltransferase involved in cell wall biosynthesis